MRREDIHQLDGRRARLHAKARTLVEQAERQGRNLTDEERTTFLQLEADRGALDVQIRRAEQAFRDGPEGQQVYLLAELRALVERAEHEDRNLTPAERAEYERLQREYVQV